MRELIVSLSHLNMNSNLFILDCNAMLVYFNLGQRAGRGAILPRRTHQDFFGFRFRLFRTETK
jgi:hypothetical protein